MADPVAHSINPTTTAHDATIDPIRTTGTDALSPESRPELNEGSAAGISEPASGMLAGENGIKGSASPVTEGVLAYKAPGLLKYVVPFIRAEEHC